MDERFEKLSRREDVLEDSLQRVYRAQDELRQVYIGVKDLPFPSELMQGVEVARNGLYMIEKLIALDLHGTRRDMANHAPPAPAPNAPWFNEAVSELNAATQKLAMNGFVGELNVGLARVSVGLRSKVR